MSHDQWCEAHLVPTAWNTAGFCNCRRRELSAEVAALRQERDAARALLREANNWIGRDCTNVREQIAELTPLCNRIDAALKGDVK